MQSSLVWDNNQWLRDANRQFHLLGLVIRRRTLVLVRQLQAVTKILIAFHMIILFTAPLIGAHFGLIHFHWVGYLLAMAAGAFQTFYSSIFASQFYLLTHLSIDLCKQYRKIVRQAVSGQSDIFIDKLLRQFCHLNLSIQHLKVYLRRSY